MILELCTRCNLHGNGHAYPRTHSGNGKKIMFVGEAPGREEAIKHIAFVGRSGKLLDAWIHDIQIDNYYITNIVKHRPVDHMGMNAQPDLTHIKACLGFLVTEIKTEKPDLIISLGRTSTFALIEETGSFTRLIRNAIFSHHIPHFLSIPLIPFFHPSYVLRTHIDTEAYLSAISEYVHADA